MVGISLSGSGEGPEGAIPWGYSTTASSVALVYIIPQVGRCTPSSRMGASSNFGNRFSVLGASVFLPFVPMAPLQILTNNLLYDFSQVPIPTDEVDA